MYFFVFSCAITAAELRMEYGIVDESIAQQNVDVVMPLYPGFYFVFVRDG